MFLCSFGLVGSFRLKTLKNTKSTSYTNTNYFKQSVPRLQLTQKAKLKCMQQTDMHAACMLCDGWLLSLHIGATVVQEVEKSFSNQKVASSIPCRSVLEQDTEPLIAPDVQCAISVNVKLCIHP